METRRIISDTSWKSLDIFDKSWLRVNCDTSEWKNSEKLATFGTEPWKTILLLENVK